MRERIRKGIFSIQDMKIMGIGACLYLCILLFASSFGKYGIFSLEETFNIIKALGGAATAILWLKHWRRFPSSLRMSFFIFDVTVTFFSLYHFINIFLASSTDSYLFNFSYHFLVITLYLGQISLFRNCETRSNEQRRP